VRRKSKCGFKDCKPKPKGEEVLSATLEAIQHHLSRTNFKLDSFIAFRSAPFSFLPTTQQ
jgi:hypothetical protein